MTTNQWEFGGATLSNSSWVTSEVGHTRPGCTGRPSTCALSISGGTIDSGTASSSILCNHCDPALQCATWKTVGLSGPGGLPFEPAEVMADFGLD
jgi:hypothetical protein